MINPEDVLVGSNAQKKRRVADSQTHSFSIAIRECVVHSRALD